MKSDAPNLNGFSQESRAVVEAGLTDGWTARRTNSGHMILLAPDGATTTCVGANIGNGRAAKNAWAPIRRYRKETRQPDPVRTSPEPFSEIVVEQPQEAAPMAVKPTPAATPAMDKLTNLAGFMSSFSDITTLIDEVRGENERLRAENDDMRAKLDMVREALGA